MRAFLRSGLLASAVLLWLAPVGFAKAPLPVLINLSASLPEGLYLRIDAPIEVGSLVAACLPPPVAGWARRRDYVGEGSLCPASTRPVLKRVAAGPGMLIQHETVGLRVAGALVPWSKERVTDRQGRPMLPGPAYPYRVPVGHLLLLADHPDSYDGRYFGPVAEGSVLGVYRPLWLWG